MSGVVLSAAVRQNLLSLQQTAQLLATTQNDLATGNRVNSALDNPTEFFTAQGLNTRASSISNLLDGISNGVQVLQAANTGITSLQNLVQNAQSVADQALQAPIGYSTLSNVSTTIGGATSTDLRGTTTYTNTIAKSNGLLTGTGGNIAATTQLDGTAGTFVGTAGSQSAGTVLLTSLTAGAVTNGETVTVNGKTITIDTVDNAPAAASSGFVKSVSGQIITDANGNSTIYTLSSSGTSTATVNDLLNSIDLASGAAVESSSGAITASNGGSLSSDNVSTVTLETSTGADLSVSSTANLLKAIGLTAASGTNTATVTASRTSGANSLGTFIQDGSTLNVDGKTITFKNAAVPASAPTGFILPTGTSVITDGNGNSTVYLQGGKVSDVLDAIDLATGAQTLSATNALAAGTGPASTVSANGTLNISTGTASDLSTTGPIGNALAALGLAGNTGTQTSFAAARSSTPGGLNGKTLTFSSFNGGTAVNVTFGDGTNGTVQTLAQLNAVLQADNLTATITSTGQLTIQAANDFASSTLGGTAGGALGGTATTALTWTTATAPVANAASQATRANLVTQYNNILDQISKVAQDASYNGINLLNGDQLQLVLDETGQSKLDISGVTDNAGGLGLSDLVQGTNFIDNNATNKILTTLQAATSSLSSLASTLGSNLSIVQNRQTFNASLINVLQTGATNLTIADPNEEAAASQALTTRQSIAVSALALANQNQQSVLQLLR